MLSQIVKPRSAWILISLFWLAALATKFKFNGLVYGFDYGLYQPDGTFYTFKTLRLLGHSSWDSANQISSWYEQHAFKMNVIDPSEFLSGYTNSWALVESRYLYQILSVPFVAAFGIPGMIAIPSLAFLVTSICTYELCRIYSQELLGVLLAVLLTMSPTLTRWSFVNCTDSILMAIFAIALIILLKRPKYKYYFLSTLVVLSSFTRFCLPIWLTLFFVLALHEKKKLSAILVSVLAIALSIPSLISAPSNAILASEEESGFIEKLSHLPISFARVTFYELAELFVLDRFLFILVILGTFLSLRSIRNLESQLFLAVLFSTLALGAINGTVGVNFRYQLPVIPFIFPILSIAISKVKDSKSNGS